MDKVLEYARYHHANPTPKEELEAEEKKTKRERLNNRGECVTRPPPHACRTLARAHLFFRFLFSIFFLLCAFLLLLFFFFSFSF